MSKRTFEERKAHYEKVRRSNALASLRLEGLTPSPCDDDKALPSMEEAINQHRNTSN